MAKALVRLKDIAVATGFSANTVSLALRESPRIPKQTRDVILSAAQALNYLPNQVAQSLVSRETKTIGLVLTDIMNPTLTFVARSLERELSALGYSLMLAATDNILAKEKEAVNVFRSRQVDGMLIYAASHRQLDHIRPLRDRGYPIVLLVPDPAASIDVVGIDDRRGAFTAVDHLLSLGHGSVGLLDAAIPLGNREKYEGYVAALADGGIAEDERRVVLVRGHGPGVGYEAMAELASRGKLPTSLFVSNDRLAIGAMRWCRDHGIGVPDDLAIVGYDDIEAAGFMETPITTMRYAGDRVSELAVKRLLTLINAPDRLPAAETTLLAPELVIRDSCGASKIDRKN